MEGLGEGASAAPEAGAGAAGREAGRGALSAGPSAGEVGTAGSDGGASAMAAPEAGGASPTGAAAPQAGGAPCPACARHKRTPRSEELQRDVKSRLNRVIGQLKGVQAMLDDNRYCGDVLTQLAAAQSALKSVSCMLLEEHIQTCVVEEIREGDESVVPELVQLIKKFS